MKQPDDLISPPEDLVSVSEETPPKDLETPPTDLQPAPEEDSLTARFVHGTESTLQTAGESVIDLADLVLSAPAWIGGMGAGLVAANKHAADSLEATIIGGERPAGEHFGAAQAVKGAILEKYGNPLRQFLTWSGMAAPAEEGKATSPVAAAMGKVGEGIQAVGKTTEKVTGSKEAGEASAFFTEMLAPAGIAKAAKGVYVGGKKVVSKAQDTFVKTPEVKTIDPEYAESKIKPEETIADVIHRKYERDALAKKLDEGEANMGELPKKAETEVPKEVTQEVKAATGRTSDTALAYTDKEGNITLNDARIEADFKAGFPYIFDASTPTGKQKAAVFERLGVTKEDLAKAIPDIETYKTFLKAHEESHVRNGDRAVYPRTPEGKADIMHPDAIAIEARATMDALKEINKPSPADVVASNVYEFITKEAIDHPASVEGASMLIEKSLNAIIAENRLVEIRSKGIVEAVPDPKVRDKMTRSIEKQRKGDMLDPKTEGKAIEVMVETTNWLKEVGEKARKAGLIDDLRNNYVPHVLDFSKSKLSPEAQASLLDRIANAPKDSKLVRDFTQERQFEFLRELEKAVEGTGVVVHTDIAKIVDAYGKAMQTAIIQKSMIDFLKVNKASDGNPWLLPDGPVAKELNYVSFEGKGTRPIRELRVHPDLVDSMNFMFRQHDPHIVLRALGGVSHLTKALNVVGSLFHAKSLIEVGLLTDPKLFAKEVMTAGSGMKAALKAFEHDGKNPVVDLLVREGGLMLKVEDVQRTIVAESGAFLDKTASDLAGKARILGEGKDLKIVQHITEPMDKFVLQKLNTFTWDYMHAAQKLNVATHLFNKMKLKNPDMTDIAIAKHVSAYVNNSFGGLNWLQVANQVHSKFLRGIALKMAGIQGREWAQIVMFAPDWTVSTLRAFTTALPKELMKPQNWEIRQGIKGLYNPRTQGDLARRYVVNTAIMWVTILNAANIALSGHNLWENKDPTRLDLGDGTSMQAAKHSMEAIHWLQHPDKTLGNKLGFWPKALFVSTTATAYPSPDAPKLKDTSLLGRAKAVGLLGMPFALSSAIQAPEGEGGKRAALSTMGMPIYGVSKEKLKASQKKGRVEAKKKRIEEKRNK